MPDMTATSERLAAARRSSSTTEAYDVAVVGGAGHVGLPLSLTLANAGLTVAIYDIAVATLDRVRRGEMPFLEAGADELLGRVLQSGRLHLSSDADVLRRSGRRSTSSSIPR
jgi:UDP-N-acetyl-D-mannosaminuronic acid dehydrogenase